MPAQYALSRVRIGTVLLALFSTTIASHGQAATPDTNVWYRLVNRHSGQVLEVFEYSTADGGNVVQWPDLNGPNQQWRFASSGEGYYRLINRNSGKAMDVYGFSTEPGGNVVQWADLNGWNQQWATPDTGNGCQQPDPGTNRHSGEQWVGIRIDNHGDRSQRSQNVRIDNVYVEGTSNHGVGGYRPWSRIMTRKQAPRAPARAAPSHRPHSVFQVRTPKTILEATRVLSRVTLVP